jgi:hypothetical protein
MAEFCCCQRRADRGHARCSAGDRALLIMLIMRFLFGCGAPRGIIAVNSNKKPQVTNGETVCAGVTPPAHRVPNLWFFLLPTGARPKRNGPVWGPSRFGRPRPASCRSSASRTNAGRFGNYPRKSFGTLAAFQCRAKLVVNGRRPDMAEPTVRATLRPLRPATTRTGKTGAVTG